MTQHTNTAHHKPAVPAAAPHQYIVLDDLVRKAVQKEWLELDYGAQWWSNDHAPTIYANSKLIPSLSSFLSNRWAELKLILQKRPVAAKKIRLKKNDESCTDNSRENIQQTCSTFQPVTNIETKPNYHQQLPTSSLSSQFSSLESIQLSNTLTMAPSPPDIKPMCLPQLDDQNHNPNNHSFLNQPANSYSMPIINGTYNNNHSEYVFDTNLSIPQQNYQTKPKTFSHLRELIARTTEPNQYNQKHSLPSCSPALDNLLKLKIRLNPTEQVARSKQHKKKVEENNMKKLALQVGDNEKPKKLKKQPFGNRKKRKRLVTIKYTGPHKLKKCFVKLEPLKDEILKKYTNKGIEDLKKLKIIKATRRRRIAEKKVINSMSKTKTVDNSKETTILSSLLSNGCPVTTLPELNLSNLLSSPPAENLENRQLSPVRTLPVTNCSSASPNTITQVVTTTATATTSLYNNTDKIETKTSLENEKASNLSLEEKLELLMSDNLSVVSIKRSTSYDSSIPLNNQPLKTTDELKTTVESTNQNISEEIPDKIPTEETFIKEKKLTIPEQTEKLDILETLDNLINKEHNTTIGNNEKSSNIRTETSKTLNCLKRRERTLSASPQRIKLNSDYVHGKIVPLGQKSNQPSLKRRSSEGSFDIPTISSSLTLSSLPDFNIKETHKKEIEKLSNLLINTNKDNENDVDNTSMDLNMNYKNNTLIQKPLTNNITLNKNKMKEGSTIFKDSDPGDSTDSNKENTFIEEPDIIEETTTKHHLDDDHTEQQQQQSPKKLRLENNRNDDNITKCNLKIDLTRMELEKETHEDLKQTIVRSNHVRNENTKTFETTERPVMDLASTNFDNYSCILCNCVFMQFKDWKMHYDDGNHPKCANVTAQSS